MSIDTQQAVFAATFDRDDNGWLKFPRDVEFRARHFVNWKEAGLAGDHPAKANLYLTEELIKITSNPGDTIADITAGSGSILIGALAGRKVIAIELTKQFTDWMHLSAKKMGLRQDQYLILQGDCREWLPLPHNLDSIVFSPPYAGAMHSRGGLISREKGIEAGIEIYGNDPRNLGLLTDFLYNKAMAEIYLKCFQSLRPGGKLSVLIKDRISKGERINLGLAAVQMMGKIGFKVWHWDRWNPPGTLFLAIHRSHGTKVIEDEHIIIMEKPA